MIDDLKSFLDEKVDQFNHTSFIKNDPILIPHQFSKKEDIEIIGYIIATIAWGNRKSILNNGDKLIDIMGNSPHEFVLNATESDLKDINFVHRTFNSHDLGFFIRAMKEVYSKGLSLEDMFNEGETTFERIVNFRAKLLNVNHEKRTEKHVSNPASGSAAKRINMFLRWMVRKDNRGVDFGLWNNIQMQDLMLPLDVHTGNISRKLGLLNRKQNDWKALEEIMIQLRKFDRNDPVKYDFALFGLGVSKEFE